MQTTPGTGQQEAKVDSSLEAMVKRFNDAFNRQDRKEVASFWADDGTLITPTGEYGEGRAGVERAYGHDVDTLLAGTTSRFTIERVRRVGNDCALLDLEHELQNFRMPDGTTGTVKLHVVMLAQLEGNAWRWLDARPYAFMRPPERLQ